MFLLLVGNGSCFFLHAMLWHSSRQFHMLESCQQSWKLTYLKVSDRLLYLLDRLVPLRFHALELLKLKCLLIKLLKLYYLVLNDLSLTLLLIVLLVPVLPLLIALKCNSILLVNCSKLTLCSHKWILTFL